LLFNRCAGGLGVDFSDYLISVANASFSSSPRHNYILSDVVDFCDSPISPERFTKAVCYGAFSYIENSRAIDMLFSLRRNFPNLAKVFIGNCPDKAHMSDFFGAQAYYPGLENKPDSPIGIWRTKDEFISMANSCGWRVEITKMPSEYYAAHYRYDVVLSNE
jgi:hypothetical protein